MHLKEDRAKTLEMITVLTEHFNAHPQWGFFGGAVYKDGQLSGIGNESIASTLLKYVDDIVAHPSFYDVDPPDSDLPEPPRMDLSFGYDAAKKFLNGERVLPNVLGRRPGYGVKKLKNRPAWWSLPMWEIINDKKCKCTRDDLVYLIASLYAHYGRPIDPTTIAYRQPRVQHRGTSLPHQEAPANQQAPLPSASVLSSATPMEDQASPILTNRYRESVPSSSAAVQQPARDKTILDQIKEARNRHGQPDA